MNTPSRTSQAVALVRSRLDRPHSPAGDPDAQRALCAEMGFTPPAWLERSIATRTEFIDQQVTAALAAGVRQVVICGAGYDDRALRFRTSGVRFFELDHPDTQADKARMLAVMAADTAGLTLVTVDFRVSDVAAALAAAGHDATQPSLFLCEGLLIYLEAATCRRLLASLRRQAAAGSTLAASLSTHADGLDSAAVLATANSRRRTAAAEPWQTIMPERDHLALLAESGWAVTATRWSWPADEVAGDHRSLLVVAGPATA